MKEEIEAANNNQRELLNKKNSRKSSTGRADSSEKRQTRASANAKKTPTKDELILFGGHSQKSYHKSHQDKSQINNPLLRRNRKEAQTEIVDRRYDEDMQKQNNASRSVYQEETDEEQEEEQRVVSQLQKERERLQKQLESNIMDEQKLKDMSILFGIPEEEVQAIQK